MISVEKAFEEIVEKATPLTTERLPLSQASGRVIATSVKARRSQPGCDVSAMDGYAVKSDDLTGNEVSFKVVGESAAGDPYQGKVENGEAVRIFTGAALPQNTDQVVIQENTGPTEDGIFTDDAASPFRHVRRAGYDFSEGQFVVERGSFITPKMLGVIASAGYGHVMVHKAPTVAILATGDELVSADSYTFLPHQTVNSTAPQIEALISDASGKPNYIGQAGDSLSSLQKAIRASNDADILVTIGGASVGDKDLIQQALSEEGMSLNFWKVAMKPGKPLIFGKRDNQYILGLPGNPASAFVCSLIYLRPLIDKLMGRPAPLPSGIELPVATSLPSNGPRQDYMRARLIGVAGHRQVDPAVSQDSGHLSVLSQCDGLIIRPPHAEPVEAGSPVPFLPF